jgi:elongation factor P
VLAKEIKPGTVVNYNASPVLIQSVMVQTPSARGAATLYKFKGRDILKKQKVNLTLKGTETLNEANFERRPAKMMYVDQTHLHLLDQTDYNQYSLPLDEIEDELNYLTEDLEGAMVLIYNEECVGISLPTSVELVITQCDPGVKGNSATSRTKPAKVQTGYELHVPEYMKEGETIKIDTRTGEYLSRA